VAEDIYCVGTVVTNRKEFPKFGKARINALGRGDHIDKQVIGNAVHCFVWRDRKLVAFVDTICKPSGTTVVSSDGSYGTFTCLVAVNPLLLNGQYSVHYQSYFLMISLYKRVCLQGSNINVGF